MDECITLEVSGTLYYVQSWIMTLKCLGTET